MNGLILPNTYADIGNKPIIFLAGPIKSAPNWHDEAISCIFSRTDNMIIASPKRKIGSSFQSYVLEGEQSSFSRQREWEWHYQEIAAKQGAILFWLPGEHDHNCFKAYGAMTRTEIGQWMTRYKYDKSVRFCVGTDEMFSEIDAILYDLSLHAPEKQVQKNLEATCDEAIRMAGVR